MKSAALACAAWMVVAGAGAAAAQAPTSAAGAGLAHRTVAGTAWQPDAAIPDALHATTRGWLLTLHGVVRLAWYEEAEPKAGSTVGGANWLMASAMRPIGAGALTLTAMGSAERWTLGECGVPRVLGLSGVCDTDGYRDYQHPHPPVMELGARYERPLAGALALELFGGLAGQPALGPPGYVHRISSADPIAPVTEHELDAAHASTGVLTAGVRTARWKVEASVFDGVARDDDVVFETPGPLRSFAARASFNPTDRWSLQASGARIEAGPGHHPGATAVLRVGTASATLVRPVGGAASAAATLAWSAMDDGVLTRHGLLFEAVGRARSHAVHGRIEAADRAEYVVTIVERENGAHDHTVSARRRRVAAVSAGYRFDHRIGPAVLGVGARVGVSVLPDALAVIYRTSRPLGIAVYAEVRPAAPAARAGMHAAH